MNEYDSFGLVEVVGLIAATEAADAMCKAARVNVRSVANADAGLLSVICVGDLAACKAAVDAGKAAAARVGEVVNSTIIPRPDKDMDILINSRIGSMFGKAEAKPEPAAETADDNAKADAKADAKPAPKGRKK